MVKKIILSLPAVFAFMMASAQNPEPFSFNPDITPSTETFQIQKYGNMRPSLYTGAMSFTVPLYTYRDEDFTIPITLDYSFDGYRPAVHSGTVGYGWALSCGGVITREVRGYPDEAAIGEGNSYGYYWTLKDKILQNDDYVIKSGKMRVDYLWDISFEEAMDMDIYSDMPLYCDRHLARDYKYETSPDIFHFNFLGITGDFILRDDGTMEVFNSSVPQGELAVEYEFIRYVKTEGSDERSVYITPQFIIKTGDGYSYVFGGVFNAVEYNMFIDDQTMITPSAFRLRKIVAPNGNEMTFSYGHHLKETKQIIAYYTNLKSFSENYFHFSDIMYHRTVISVFASPLTSIAVNGKAMIGFTYEENGHDEDSIMSYNDPVSGITNYANFYYQLPMDLRDIDISNYQGDTVAHISLDKEFTGYNPSRMFLSGINSTLEGKYSFSYKGILSSPPHNNTNGTDFWGFWNVMGYMGLITNYLDFNNFNNGLYDQFKSGFTGKDPAFSGSSYGALTRIVYPAGGHSDITYEQNTVSQRINKVSTGPYYEACPSGNMDVGGVRVKRIDNTGDGMSDYVEYSYNSLSDSSRSSGILMYMPLYGMRVDYKMRLLDSFEPDVKALGFTDECDTAPRRDPTVVYTQAKETFADGSYNTYEFDFQEDVYPHSERNYEVLAKNLGKIQILLPNEDDSYYATAIRNYVLPPMMDYSQTRGQLTEKCEYDASGRLMMSEATRYDTYMACSRVSYYNALLDFVKMDCRWYSSRMSGKVITQYYGNGAKMDNEVAYYYNQAGQIEEVRQYSSSLPRTESTSYRYYHETAPDCPQWLKSAVSDIASTVTVDGCTYLASLRKIRYDTYGDSSNPYPLSITDWSSAVPSIVSGSSGMFSVPDGYEGRTGSFAYNSKFRLTGAYYPLGAYVKYMWDSDMRHIVSKETDSQENISRYSWKDLVGVTRIEYPTTGFNLFGYDPRGRLSEQRDLDGRLMYRYMYHLENE